MTTIRRYGAADNLLFAVLRLRWAGGEGLTSAMRAAARELGAAEFKQHIVAHGLAGVALRFHRSVLEALFGPRFIAELQMSYVSAALNCNAQIGTVRNISGIFARAGLRWALLKGVGLSLQLYDDPHIRSAGDIDVLVDPADLAAAVSLLERSGLAMVAPTDRRYVRSRWRRWGQYHLTMAAPGGSSVEVHWRSDFAPQLSLMPLSQCGASLGGVSLDACSIPCLEGELLVAYVARHAYRSMWLRWKWLYDVLCLIERHAALNGRDVLSLSHEPSIARTVSLARHLMQLNDRCHWARFLGGAHFNPEAALAIRDHAVDRFLAKLGRQEEPAGAQLVIEFLQQSLFQSAAIEGIRRKGEYFAWRALRLLSRDH